MKFQYTEKESSIFGKLLKPLIYFEVLSQKYDLWYGIDEALVDTGADITLVPEHIGKVLVDDIKNGKKVKIKGISKGRLTVYIHDLKLKISGVELVAPVAIANTNDVPSVVGRKEMLDAFKVEFFKGKELSIEE